MQKQIFKIFLLGLTCLAFFQNAKADDPTNNPLIYANNLEYLGAFKVPAGTLGNSSFSFGGSVLAYNAANNSLFMVGHDHQQSVAEISIPAPVKSANIADLNQCTVLQNFADITEGNLANIGVGGAAITANPVKVGGLLVSNNKLIGTAYDYYDGAGETFYTHFTSGLNLAATGDFSGMFKVGSTPTVPTPSFVDGYMAHIPSEWQSIFGGPALVGQGTIPITGRTSFGPGAFVFDPEKLGVLDPVPATPLLYYSEENPNLGGWWSTNPFYNGNTGMRGMVFPDGTRTVLYFGTHALSDFCYGDATDDPTLINKINPEDGNSWCYDLEITGGKGPHGFPHLFQVWAFDANDLTAVKNGEKKPWEILPYATWNLTDFDFKGVSVSFMAAAYDSATQRLFLVQPGATTEGCCDILPVVHIYHLDLTAAAAASYNITGKVVALDGTLVLQNNGGETVSINSTDPTELKTFSFPTAISSGASYNVTVATQPAGQLCNINSGVGQITANSDIYNILATCLNDPGTDTQAPALPASVVVSAQAPTKIMVTWSPATDNVLVEGYNVYRDGVKVGTTSSGRFIDSGLSPETNYSYQVEVFDFYDNVSAKTAAKEETTPAATGINLDFTIGGTVSGLSGTVVLQDIEGDKLSVSGNGSFVFNNPETEGNNYSVTIFSQPAGQTCSVANGTGVVSANVTNITINCSNNSVIVAKSSSSSKKKKKDPTPRSIRNSHKTLSKGMLLTQTGKHFSKNSFVNLYFSKFGGGYYPPMKVKTSKSGTFSVSYIVNKPKGTYNWYAVDLKKNKKSKKATYKIR